MNAEKLQCQIKEIENEKLRDYLLSCLKHECELNFTNTPSVIIEKATQRFENKIKLCQKIEKDLPNDLIWCGDLYLLRIKLDTLRLNFAILHVNEIYELTEDALRKLKTFISNILSLQSIHLKLKVFDLILILLERATEFQELSKEFIKVYKLLESLINDPHAFNSYQLSKINDFFEKDIKKNFYRIVYELNQKLIFQDLLNQLLIIISNYKKVSLMEFNHKFITNFSNDQEMDADDLSQLLTLTFCSLKHYELASKNEFHISIFSNSLTHYLLEFENECKEKIPKIKLELKNFLPNLTTDKSYKSNISIYFPESFKNEKLMVYFNETKRQILEKNKKIEINDHFSFRFLKKKAAELSNKAIDLKTNAIENAIELANNATENLKIITETSTERLKGFISKKTKNPDLKANEEVARNDLALKSSLINAKTELSSIKKVLDTWKSKLNYLSAQSDTIIDIPSINLNQNPELLVNDLRFKIDEKFSELIRITLDELESINASSKRKGYWLAKLEKNKPSFVKRVLIRGYFNIDYSVKKIKAKLGNTLSYSEIAHFITKKSFWGLLFNFGIVCWPWMDRTFFAYCWAEQLCLPEIINQTEKLKTLASKEEFLEKVILLSNSVFLFKNQAIVQILQDFKRYIVSTFERINLINQKIEESLNETNYAPPLSTTINGLFSKIASQPKVNLMTVSAITLSAL